MWLYLCFCYYDELTSLMKKDYLENGYPFLLILLILLA
jgi:hypothetical protein